MKILQLHINLAVLLGVACAANLHAQTSAFTYQGSLSDNGSPASGLYDLRFTLYDDPSAGAQQGDSLTNAATAVANGLFAVTLDFGSVVFDGSDRWLEIGVRTNGGGAFGPLIPRQPITSTPYALRALNLSSNALASYGGAVSFTNPSNTFAGDGSSLSNINVSTLGGLSAANFWQLGGNAGTTPGAHFLGTTDNQALEFKVNGVRALRVQPEPDTPILIGGFSSNTVGGGSPGAVIAGGGLPGLTNSIGPASAYSAIGGGFDNIIEFNSGVSVISGGAGNTIGEDAQGSAISGGFFNAVRTDADYSNIGGGEGNSILANASHATIAGGRVNTVLTNADFSVIGGGRVNRVGQDSFAATIAGGSNNVIGADSSFGSIGGGSDNNIATNSPYATIAGGAGNDIGKNSGDSVIGGGVNNRIADNSSNATIAGGVGNDIGINAPYSAIGGGFGNDIADSSDIATIAGGQANDIGQNSYGSTIGGGANNNIAGSSLYATIAGGTANDIGVNADFSAIGGGENNNIGTNSQYATIGGGFGNELAADYATVGGGRENVVTSVDATVGGGSNNEARGSGATTSGGINNRILVGSPWATISGGYNNTVNGTGATIGGGNANATTNSYSTVAGGQGNVASKSYAMVPGGANNTADGTYAFAAGRRAKADHNGAFVWGDSFDDDVVSTNNNSVTMRASGGYRLFSDTGAAAGVFLAAGGNSWASISDRDAKKNFTPVDPSGVLEKLVQVPVQQWNYQSEADAAVPHIGPMAQDFKAAFYPGRDDKSISTLEFDGVALAAIQGLNEKVERGTRNAEARAGELERKLEQKETEITVLKARLEKLEQLLNDKLNGGAR